MLTYVNEPSRDTLTPHRNYVAHNANYETGITVFQVLLEQGLKSTHRVCDVGCGSLRVGRYLITHLEHGNYYGIEPNEWLIDAALEHEIGTLASVKQAHFACRDDFNIKLAFPFTSFDIVLISSVLAHATHNQMAAALTNAMLVSNTCVFDTVPGGSDWTQDHWQYPEVSYHDDECVLAALPPNTQLTKLTLGCFGEQWWRLDRAD